MKEIIHITFASAKDNTDQKVEISGETFHVRTFGAQYSIDLALALVKKFREECDAFAISGFPQDITLRKKLYSHRFVQEIKTAAAGVPVHDGSLLRKAAMPWSLKKYIDQDKFFLANKKVGFYTGLAQWSYLNFFDDLGCSLVFAGAGP